MLVSFEDQKANIPLNGSVIEHKFNYVQMILCPTVLLYSVRFHAKH